MTRQFCRAHSCARRGFNYVDVLVLLCLMPFLVLGCYMGSGRDRDVADRVKCASNLRQIGQAMILYADDNHGAYPRVRTSSNDSPRIPTYGTGTAATQPTNVDGPKENDVTSAMFMLLRTQDITAEVFCCPNSNSEKDLFDGKDQTKRSNFTEFKKNLSYSLQNPYANQSAIDKGWKWDNTIGAEYAIAADVNPGVKGKDDNVLRPAKDSGAREMRLANSNNHGKDGQNILYGDGHVAWESNPFVGVNRDNIYTTRDGQVDASPVDGNDSILLPTDD